jgi:hypothetical protein
VAEGTVTNSLNKIPIDVNTKTMNMYIQKKNLTTMFFY